MKLRKIISHCKRILTLHEKKKKKDFSRSISETSENVSTSSVVSVSWLVSSGVYIVFTYSISLVYKYLPKLIKRRSKVQEKKMSCESALNFEFWPMKNISPKL